MKTYGESGSAKKEKRPDFAPTKKENLYEKKESVAWPPH